MTTVLAGRPAVPIAEVFARGAGTVYRLYDADGRPLYIGSTGQIAGLRLAAHRGDKPWWPEVAFVTFEDCATLAEARQRESAAIQDERPKYNVKGREMRQMSLLDAEGWACSRCSRPLARLGRTGLCARCAASESHRGPSRKPRRLVARQTPQRPRALREPLGPMGINADFIETAMAVRGWTRSELARRIRLATNVVDAMLETGSTPVNEAWGRTMSLFGKRVLASETARRLIDYPDEVAA